MGETEIEKVKVKLLRNPTIALSPNHEKSYTPWTRNTVEGYCKFRVMLDEYIKQISINNLIERINSVSLLLSGTPLSNWQISCHNCMMTIFGTKIRFKRLYAFLILMIVVPWHTRNIKYS
jgi:hypothetical protein